VINLILDDVDDDGGEFEDWKWEWGICFVEIVCKGGEG
jgi:hypothetical protein